MAAGLQIVIHADYKEVTALLDKIATRNPGGMREGLDTISLGAKALLDSFYAGGPKPSLAKGTLLKRRFGKHARPGRPAVATYSGSKPLHRSGTMIEALYRKSTGRLQFTIGFDDVLGETTGDSARLPVGDIANMQEFGYVRSVPFTKRMQTYLMLLYGTITSPEQAGKFNFRPRTLVVKVPARPVWGRMWKEVTPQAPRWFFDAWSKYVGLKG